MNVVKRFSDFRKNHKTALVWGGSLAVITLPLAYNFASAGSPNGSSHNDTSANVLSSQSSSEAASAPNQNDNNANSSSAASGQAQNQNQTDTSVTVNGQSIGVPSNGHVQQTITDGNGQTHVDINSQQQTSTTNGGTHSSSSLNVSTHTQSSQSTEKEQGDE